MAMDTFGDGFGSGLFYVFDTHHIYEKYAATCDKNPVVVEYCFDPNSMEDGDSVSATLSGLNPSHKWEVCVLYYKYNKFDI